MVTPLPARRSCGQPTSSDVVNKRELPRVDIMAPRKQPPPGPPRSSPRLQADTFAVWDAARNQSADQSARGLQATAQSAQATATQTDRVASPLALTAHDRPTQGLQAPGRQDSSPPAPSPALAPPTPALVPPAPIAQSQRDRQPLMDLDLQQSATQVAGAAGDGQDDSGNDDDLIVDPHIYVQGWQTPPSRQQSSRASSQRGPSRGLSLQRRAPIMAPLLDAGNSATSTSQTAQPAQQQWLQQACDAMQRKMENMLAAKFDELFAAQSQAASPSAADTKPSFQRANKAIDLATLLQRDSTSSTYITTRGGRKPQALRHDDSDDDEEDDAAAPGTSYKTPTLVMAATGYVPRQGRWVVPKDIPQLTEEVEDIDWWFHKMQIHLNNCRIVHRQERIDCLHTHTEDAFHQRVWQRCDAEKVERSQLYKNEDTYGVFVADRFSKATAMQQLQRKLDALAGKALTPVKAWDAVYRLSFCYNEKAKRKSRPLLSQADITRHFISALPSNIRECMRSMVLHDHPMLYDASHALTAASRYVEEQALEAGGRDDMEGDAAGTEVDDQSAMLASRGRTAKKRGRQGDSTGRKSKVPAVVSQQTPEQASNTTVAPSTSASPALAALPNNPKANTETRTCYKCKQTGHLKRDCPQLRTEGGQERLDTRPPRRHLPYQKQSVQAEGRPTCTACGKVGHTADRCWLAHPELRPRGWRPRVPSGGAPATTANAVPVSTGNSAMTGLATAARTSTSATTDVSWLHPAEFQEGKEAAYLTLAAAGDAPPLRPHHDVMALAPTLLALAALKATPATTDLQPLVPNPCRCLLFLHTLHRNRTLRLVVDTGASVNLVSAAVLDNSHARQPVPPFEIKGVNGHPQTLTEQVQLAMDLSGCPYVFTMYVTANLPICAILGLDAIIEAGWLVDAIHRRLLHVHHALPPLHLAPCTHTVLLARTCNTTVIPARSWKHVKVWHPHTTPPGPSYVCACLVPALPASKPLHGVPVLVAWTNRAALIPLCNAGNDRCCRSSRHRSVDP